ncbi:MAG TPA: hypothetical protein VFV50_11305, partial [Bdellovibrionales bacterium]|nr:hypothetical protein [Bdellovibrionales bacterium]
ARVMIPLPKELKYQFNNDAFVYAYLAHVMYLVDAFKPDHIGFGIENNIMLTKIVETAATPDSGDDIPYEAWIDFTKAMRRIHAALKTAYPQKKLFYSLSADDYNYPRNFDFGSSQAAYNLLIKAINHTKSPYLYNRYVTGTVWQREHLKLASDFNDLIAISTYPFMAYGTNVAGIPADYLTRVREVAPSKPFAVAETGYIAEPLVYPDPLPAGTTPSLFVDGNTTAQAQYVSRLLADATKQNALFVNWFIVRDYDDMWKQVLVHLPGGETNRIWRDIGLFDGNGNSRLSLFLWHTYLWRGVQP